jgi:hypothetical protein
MEMRKERGKILLFQARKELSLDNLGQQGWKEAMTLPLPRNPSRELLEKARADVIQYLDYYSEKIANDRMEYDDTQFELQGLIEKVAGRLWEITLALYTVVNQESDGAG